MSPQLPFCSATNGASRMGMILSPASDPIPYRLVQKIQAGEFVEMRDLLTDNISLHNQLEALHGHFNFSSTPASLRPSLREVPSLSSWMYRFAAYMAVRTTDPQLQEMLAMLAYCRLIIREALRQGGNGWQEYNQTFRRQAAIDTTIPWNTIVPSLQAATLGGSRGTTGTLCTICMEPDHHANQCALTVTKQPVRQPVPPTDVRRGSDNTRRFQRGAQRRPETVLGICASWNRGTCAFLGSCTYKHICAVCQLNHKGMDCPTAPVGSPYQRLQTLARRPPVPAFPTTRS